MATETYIHGRGRVVHDFEKLANREPAGRYKRGRGCFLFCRFFHVMSCHVMSIADGSFQTEEF